jgi:hypothetical protein
MSKSKSKPVQCLHSQITEVYATKGCQLLYVVCEQCGAMWTLETLLHLARRERPCKHLHEGVKV